MVQWKGREGSKNIEDIRPPPFPDNEARRDFLLDTFKRARQTGLKMPWNELARQKKYNDKLVSEGVTEQWLLKRHEMLMQKSLMLEGPNDPKAKDLERRSRNNSRWYTETYNRNRGIGEDIG